MWPTRWGNNTLEVDIPSMKEVAKIAVGQVPKRNYTIGNGESRAPRAPIRAHHWPVNQLVCRLALSLGRPRRIIQTSSMIAILFEAYNHYRQIFLDGRPLPEPIQPAYMGYSVGKWDNDTLVVETTGFIGDGWTTAGIPKPNRYMRPNASGAPTSGTLSMQLTIDGAGAYTKPWTVNL